MRGALLATIVAVSSPPAPPTAPPATLTEVVKPLNDLLAHGKYAEGLKAAEALARRAQREGNVPLQARALLLASDALYYLNRQVDSKPYMERALALSEGIGDPEGIGRAYYS